MTGRRWARRRRTRAGARGSARARLPRRCRRAKKRDEKTHERELGLGRHVVVARGARRALLVDGRALRRRVLLDVLLRALEHARACEKDNRRTVSSNACGRGAALRAARPARLAALARGGALPRHSRRVRAAAFSTLRFAAVLAASASRALRFFSTLSGTNLRQGGRGQQGQAARWWRAEGARHGCARRRSATQQHTKNKARPRFRRHCSKREQMQHSRRARRHLGKQKWARRTRRFGAWFCASGSEKRKCAQNSARLRRRARAQLIRLRVLSRASPPAPIHSGPAAPPASC